MKTYPLEFRQRQLEMYRAGRSAESLARDFEPTAQTIRNWAAQADRDAERRSEGLSSSERTELRELRRDNRRLEEELAILGNAAAWFAQKTDGSTPKQRSSAT
ncbi:MAG: transposase [Anaerolineae bacterium]